MGTTALLIAGALLVVPSTLYFVRLGRSGLDSAMRHHNPIEREMAYKTAEDALPVLGFAACGFLLGLVLIVTAAFF